MDSQRSRITTHKKRVAVFSLGCRLNQSEAGLMSRSLERGGYEIVPFNDSSADAAIINTCTVTSNADSDCRNAIRSFIRKNPRAFVAVVGCYSQMGAKEIAEIEGVDLIIGNQEKLDIVNYLKTEKNTSPLIIKDIISRDDFTIEIGNQTSDKTRANLKIQDGCSFMCSFCIIPFARGRERSRDFHNLLDEAKQLAEEGTKELILTGVNVGTFNNSGENICGVVNRLNNIPGIERIRISSIEPTTIPEELFVMMNDPKHALVPYLHIPLQSGSDTILNAMKRKYTASEFIHFIEDAHSKVQDLCIGSDIMTGFPGETEDDFAQSANILRETPLSYAHIFTYSERENTPAVKMPNKIEHHIKKERTAVLRELSARQKKQFYQKFIGKDLKVLFESEQNGYWFGYTENYIRVAYKSEKNLSNIIQTVKLDKQVADYVQAL